jgi:hypothetical protein
VTTSKTIAVPPNPRARRGVRLAAAAAAEVDEPVELSPIALKRAARPVQAAPVHSFRVGDRLRMGSGGYSVARIAATCKVVALLPYEGHGALLYRVRSDAEAFERVVAEAVLSRG